MCGIAGYSCFGDKFDPRLNVAITILGIQMQNRGRQSWGWTDGEQIVKVLGEFDDSFNGSFQTGYLKAALHTRHATTGSVTKENQHPWKFGDEASPLVGMHNGIVHNHDELNKQYNRDFAVDSMHIFQHILEGKPLSEVQAYGAICFFKDGNIHVGRFNGGELTVVKTEIGWLFASTRYALEMATRLSGLDKNIIYYKLKEERLYRLNGKQLEVVKEIPLNVGNYSKHWGGWEDGAYTQGFYSGRKGNQTGNTGSGTSGATSSGSDVKVTDRRHHQKASQQTGGAANFTVGYKTTDEKIQHMIRVALEKAQGVLKPGTDSEASSESSGTTTETPNPTSTGEPGGWKCGYCETPLNEGDEYYFNEMAETVCTDCGFRYMETMESGPFTKFPLDIFRFEAVRTGPDDEQECDDCHEKFGAADWVIQTPDNDIVCMQCWIETQEEPSDTEDKDELSADDIADEDLAGESAYEAAEAAYHQSMEERFIDALAKDETPAAAAVNNEAENLKQFGAGMVSGFRNMLM